MYNHVLYYSVYLCTSFCIVITTLYVGMGPFFSDLEGFDTPETHIRHVQNLILIAEMESAIYPRG